MLLTMHDLSVRYIKRASELITRQMDRCMGG